MFSISSKFYTVSVRIYQLICLNFLLIVFSLPIVTVGAAFSATIQVDLAKHGVDIWRPFLTYFKQAFKQSLPLLLFNVFSLFFIISLNTVAFNGSNFLHLIKLVFTSFIISYNINTYVIDSIFDGEKIMEVFRLTFIFTIGTFFKTCFFPLLSIGLVYVAISVFGYSTFLFITSLPIAVYLFLIKKDIRKIEKTFQNPIVIGE